jgi:uncharacterized protein YndB with AHSA1/START domain
MTQQTADLAVRRSIVVEAPQERAFTLFTEGMSTWWPLATHHIGEKDAAEAVVEPKAGGRWFERAADGTECEWGRVIEWEPPERVVFGWQLRPDWKFDPDESRSSEVEVRFIAEGPATTRVELEHRGFERMGEGAAAMSEAVASPGGWGSLLELFAAALRA